MRMKIKQRMGRVWDYTGIHTGFSAKGGGGGGDRGQGGVGSNCRVAFFRDLRKGYRFR